MMKTCFKCGVEQPLDDFYKHPAMAGGHLNKCKSCTKSDVKADYRANPQAHSEYDRKREQTPERKAQKADAQRRYRAANRIKSHARGMVDAAIRLGKLVPGSCHDCGTTEKIEGHHEDYAKPLDVIWLCFDCHRIRHGQTVLPVLNLETP